jgi:hypothetical protein
MPEFFRQAFWRNRMVKGRTELSDAREAVLAL